MPLKTSTIIGIGAAAVGSYALLKTTGQLEKVEELLQRPTPQGRGLVNFPDLSFLGDIFKNIPQSQLITTPFAGLNETFSNIGQRINNIDDTVQGIISNAKNAVAETADKVKDTVEDITKAPGKLVNNAKEAAGNLVKGATEKVTGAPARAGIDPVKAGVVLAGGAGAVQLLSGVFPPLRGVLLAGGAVIYAATKLRQKGIRREVPGGYEILAPETAIREKIKDVINPQLSFFKNLFVPFAGGPPKLSLKTPLTSFTETLKRQNLENRLLAGTTATLTNKLKAAQRRIVELGRVNRSSGSSRRAPGPVTAADLLGAARKLNVAEQSGFIGISDKFKERAREVGVPI